MSHPFQPQPQPSTLPPAQPGQSIASVPELPSVGTLLKPDLIDRAVIFTDVTRRNAVRRQAQLPLLDVRAEFECGVALAEQRAYREFAATHAAERRRITDDIVLDYVAKHGSRPGTSFTWWWIGAEANRRHWAYLKQQYGVVPPASVSRNQIVYGSARPMSGESSSPLPSNNTLASPDVLPEGSAR